MTNSQKSLEGIRVLDLSRVLAGPFCTQMLGDLGAEIIKVERPGFDGQKGGDDTRGWGPPFLKDKAGDNTSESAYYLGCNRNKKSVSIDIKTKDGQKLIHQLIAKSDILIQNFKVGGLDQYGLSYEQLKDQYPRLIYCSISGFGQNGPLAREPGYDFLAQAMAGLMACTGEPEGQPMKVGVALSDIMTGLNAGIGILAALRHRDQNGSEDSGGQMIDVALTDCTLASMTNIAQYYLTSGDLSPRLGNAHSAIVPYQVFKTADSFVILAVGNDTQFARFAALVGHKEWGDDDAYKTNSQRVGKRAVLIPLIENIMRTQSSAHWIEACEAINVPCGPVNTMDQVFAMEQTQARDMQIEMEHALSPDPISLVGSPIKMSETPVSYDLAPPICGQDTDAVLKEVLDLDAASIAELKASQIIGS